MNKVVLIIDDDPNDMQLAYDLIGVLGYSCIKAFDGIEGVAAAKKHKPALILMDILMPNMDGYAACNAIKTASETKNIPIVMLTAVDYELNKDLATEVGADGYLAKPYSRQQLMQAISPYLTTG